MNEIFSKPDGLLLTGIVVGVMLVLIPFILFLLTLQKTLQTISPENRKMPPGNVWLMLIPLFNIVWQFIVVSRIADSLRDECLRLNIPVNEQRPTHAIGLTYCICNIVSGLIPIFGPLAALTIWIMYWIKVNQYKKLLIANKDNYVLDAEREIFHTLS
jgi:hypothetical protein